MKKHSNRKKNMQQLEGCSLKGTCLSFVTKLGTGPRYYSGTAAAYGFARNDYQRAASAGRVRTKSKCGLASATRNWRCSWVGSKWGGRGAKTGIEKGLGERKSGRKSW